MTRTTIIKVGRTGRVIRRFGTVAETTNRENRG